MKIVSTFYKPSSVLCSVKCNLTSTGLEHLVVAKLDGLDVYSVRPEGLKHECRWNVWGNILSDSSRSNLIVMLDHPEPELVFLTYTQSDAGGMFSTTKRLELVERNHNQRPAEFFNDVLVHPDGKLALVSCYTGKLKVVVLNNGNYKSDCDASILDLVILSLAFLPSPGEREIAILYYDHTRRVQLHARTLVKDNDSASYDISYDLSTVLHPTPISTKILPYPEEAVPKLIPVPCPLNATDSEDESETFLGGVLLVGGTRILLFELLSENGQAKQRNKRRKLEQRKESGNKSEVEKATQKQQERDTRKRKPKASVDWPWSEITSWCALDGEPFRYFIGDSFGRLSMLSLHDVPNNGLVLIPLGETSPPTTLTYLANQVLYVGSHAGDSQLVQISSTSLSSSDESPTLPIPPEIKTVVAARLVPPSVKGKGREELSEPLRDCVLDVKGPYIRVIDTFKNVAPILDAVLVDTDNSGHRQIVTCSGGQNTGSIHVIRKGADFQQLATIPGMAHAVSVFTLKTKSDAVFDSHILVSTLQESHVFELTSNDTLEVTESDAGFAPGRTLAARNVQRGIVHEATKRGNVIITPETTEYQDTALVVQVTPNGAFLLEYEMGLAAFTRVHHYDATARGDRRGLQVVAASINATQTVLALNDGTLLCLEVRRNTLILKSETLRHDREVSALSCTPLNPESNISSQFVAVAHWKTNDVEILQFEQGKFNSVCQTNPLGAVVRSLLLYDFGTPTDPRPYLLAGFGDGSFVSFSWNVQERTLTEPNLTSLGDLPVHFTPCRVNGKEAVFAAGSRAMVLTWQRDSIHQSPVILKYIRR
ncbi:mono-functional DNA-alkylating methyl methanesulfonate N-term-domain-containing protein [Mycena olivaceomarginata]|nr:mono-functional DNA-alkylating methyl methanesulfonate N-term-domain-containing protein [Mycena olivaceomarginata]